MNRLRRWRMRALAVGALAAVTVAPVAVSAGTAPAAAAPAPATAPPAGHARVDPAVRAEAATARPTDFWVVLGEHADLSAAPSIADWNRRGRAVLDALRATADRSQRDLRGLLDQRRLRYTPYWAVNAVLVRGGSAADVDAVAARTDVAEIAASRSYELPPTERAAAAAPADGVEWGVADIGADRVWSEFGDRGAGIVVGSIDGGVQFDHPALVAAYRGNRGDGTFDHDHNWFDATGTCPNRAVPCGDGDHGTHTMGTMVGDGGPGNRIGVAPGARWISAKACNAAFCADSALLAAGQWMLAPTTVTGTDPDPARRPHVVNNSWGSAAGNAPFFRDIVTAWRAAGMFPVFSNGNAGPACGTTGIPAAYPEAFGVGAYDGAGTIASFSSRGPSPVGGLIKPDVSAPGVSVRSAGKGGGYLSLDGTSMAAPHVTGAVALIWAATPALVGQLDATAALIDGTARHGAPDTCGGTAADNNAYGHGRLDAFTAVGAARQGGFGDVSGKVTDPAGAPLPDAQVSVNGVVTHTGTDGSYRLAAPAGSWQLSFWKYGSVTVTRAVTVLAGQPVTVDAGLPAAALTTVRGTVRDHAHGWPLYAKVSVSPQPGGAPVFTDPLTGQWSVQLPDDGRFTVQVTPVLPGYASAAQPLTLPGAAPPVTEPELAGCTAPGYAGDPCRPVAGGLVLGTVTGTGTPGGVTGATVSSATDPKLTASTLATPDDPALRDGFYTLFTPAGRRPLLAAKKFYAPATGTATVAANKVTRLDLAMRAAVLSVGPAQLSAQLPIGGRTSVQLTVTNTGDVSTTFGLAERGYLSQSDPVAPSRTGRSAARTQAERRAQLGPRPPAAGTAAQPRASGTAAAAGAGWTAAPNLPTPLQDSTAVSVDGTIYSIGGWNNHNGSDVSTVTALDPATGTWAARRSLAFARQKPAAAVIDGRIYVAGGWHAFVSDGLEIPAGLEIYDPAADTWTFRTGPPNAYGASAGVALDGKFYLIGGCDEVGRCSKDDVYRYDPATRRWATMAPYPQPASWLSCGAIDGEIICAGGANDSRDLRDTYAYDPAGNTWTARAPMPDTRWASAYTTSDGLLLVSGGIAGGELTDTGAAYDASADEWFALPSSGLPTYRAASACGLYQFGGIGADGSATAAGRLLPGHEACGPATDVPWLAAPTSRQTLAPGRSVRLTVPVDAAAVNAPGVVRAALTLVESTPGTVDRIPVTLTVTPSAAYAQVAATVTGAGRCGAGIGPLTSTSVTVAGRRQSRQARTDGHGNVAVWVDPSDGPVTVTARRPGLTTATASTRPRAGSVSTVALTERRRAPCAGAQPGAVTLTAAQGRRTGATLTLDNTGLAGYRAGVAVTDLPLSALPGSRQDVVAAGVRPRVEAPHRTLTPPYTGGWRTAADYPGPASTFGRGVTCPDTPGIIYTFEDQRAFRYDASTDTWTETHPKPQGTEVAGSASVCDGHVIHFFGGYSVAGRSLRHLTYDVIADAWQTDQIAQTPEFIDSTRPGAAAAFDGKVYFVFATGHVFRYDPGTDAWSGQLASAPVPLSQTGYAQAGRYLYLAGGWTRTAPSRTVQRLDLLTMQWQRGPDLPVATATAALVSTDTALYYLGGSSDPVEHPLLKRGTAASYRLPLADFGTGGWSPIENLPKAAAHPTGGCTEAVLGGEVWSVTGSDERRLSHRTNAFRGTPGEHCDTLAATIPWLHLSRTAVTVAAGSHEHPQLTVDTRGLAAGTYRATILVRTDDPGAPQLRIPVELTVTGHTPTNAE
ncbi:MAG TPA: S8 family serine peptidase [Mycobacteriales bacterium]|nr:S8 family serine peptidase [Mycobacteriales bacterium]